eukprot:GHVN01031834.1.p1 GENE.GHVN01031834.1~~GHVN01031834.1.p1  ORF type:complete len:236 (-),score=30.95 GHVN01031834.1:244-951(-)
MMRHHCSTLILLCSLTPAILLISTLRCETEEFICHPFEGDNDSRTPECSVGKRHQPVGVASTFALLPSSLTLVFGGSTRKNLCGEVQHGHTDEGQPGKSSGWPNNIECVSVGALKFAKQLCCTIFGVSSNCPEHRSLASVDQIEASGLLASSVNKNTRNISPLSVVSPPAADEKGSAKSKHSAHQTGAASGGGDQIDESDESPHYELALLFLAIHVMLVWCFCAVGPSLMVVTQK